MVTAIESTVPVNGPSTTSTKMRDGNREDMRKIHMMRQFVEANPHPGSFFRKEKKNFF